MFAQDQGPVHVLVVDDSDVYHYAICAVVSATPGFEVVGIASSGEIEDKGDVSPEWPSEFWQPHSQSR